MSSIDVHPAVYMLPHVCAPRRMFHILLLRNIPMPTPLILYLKFPATSTHNKSFIIVCVFSNVEFLNSCNCK